MPTLTDTLKPFTPPRVRRALIDARFKARFPTAALRRLPDFLVIGGMRCGTSSLYKYLSHHPLVVPPLRKEIEFFSMRYALGVSWYRAHFPLGRRNGDVRGERRHSLTFEATPYYMFHPLAASRAGELVPGAKLIALLRNPIDRAYSHYRHMVDLGFEQLAFEEAIAAEAGRLEGEEQRIVSDPRYPGKAHHRFSYLSRGIYTEQLQRWLQAYPRDQLLLVRSEDLYSDPGDAYGEILRFLGLPEWRPAQFRNYSRGKEESGGVQIEPATRRDLAAYFAPHNLRLRELLGVELDWDC